MENSEKKIKRRIENIDFCIWLFSRYNSKTANEITRAYKEIKKQLEQKLKENPNKNR